jgi:carbamoylphosphate synthase large subunit
MLEHDGDALVIGPGPVTLPQGPAFQYMAARGCGILRRHGKRVLVLEDNPATLMDIGGGEEDLYMEPAAVEVVQHIVENSHVGSIWYGLGGRRSWLLAMRLAREEWYEQAGMVTPDMDDRTLWLCGDRSLLREALEQGGIFNPAFHAVGGLREGQEAAERLGFPLVVRAHFSCGGSGAGLAYNLEDYPALLEEAMRESLTGEVLVEEALEGWRKYIALVLRDADGRTSVAGVFEQLEPLPLHDEDAVLVYPAQRCGRDGEYAVRELARKAVEVLDLVGVIEVKLAAAPGWEALYVIDVNPRPWRTTPLLETARGIDLLGAHIDLVMGKSMAQEHVQLERKRPAWAVVATPSPSFLDETGGEGYLSLASRSMGRGFFRGSEMSAAAACATGCLRRNARASASVGAIYALGELSRQGGRNEAAGMVSPGPSRGDAQAWSCLSRTAEMDTKHAVLLVAADNAAPAGGYEANVNCLHALRAWKQGGAGVVLYTPDPGFALYAAPQADAVFLGPTQAEEIAQAAASLKLRLATVHFGGRSAFDSAPGLAAAGLDVMGMGDFESGSMLLKALEKLRLAGLRVVDFTLSESREEGEALLRRTEYPLLATVEEARSQSAKKMVYGAEDGKAFLYDHAQEKILWRPLREEAQEVQVEAVASQGGHTVLLWEQLDAAGIFSTDGLAVYPPRYLTSEQSGRALELARQAMDVLGWRGNLSMRIYIYNGDIDIWSISPGASANLPFLDRAASLPLAAIGMRALGGMKMEAGMASDSSSAVRAPLIPFGLIADFDILPSPQRRSTGSVMGVADDPGIALAKALWSQGLRPQPGGKVFLSVANREKRRALMLARELQGSGHVLMATRGTAHALETAGLEVETVNKLREGRPNVLDLIRNGQVGLVINVPRGKHPHSDGFYIRAASVRHGIPCITNMEVALALARGMRQADPPTWDIRPLFAYVASGHKVGGA